MKPFGKQIQEHRLKCKLSQSQFAKKHGICIHSLQNWEQGKSNPLLQDTLKLVKIMSLPPIVRKGEMK